MYTQNGHFLHAKEVVLRLASITLCERLGVSLYPSCPLDGVDTTRWLNVLRGIRITNGLALSG